MMEYTKCSACEVAPSTIERGGRKLCDGCARTLHPNSAKVVALPVAPRADIDSIVDLPPIRVREAWRDHLRDPAKCHHPSVLVRDGVERGVECGTCGKELDAIALLMQYAEGDRRILHTLEALRAAKKNAQEEAERIARSSKVLRRKRAVDVAKHPILGTLVTMRAQVARRLQGHPDEEVARLRATIRHALDDMIARAIRKIESDGEADSVDAESA